MATLNLKRKVEGFKVALVTQALQDHNGNRTAAARALGITRPTVHYYIDRYGINVPRRRRTL